MIIESRGNLLHADVDALVNTVNTVGVMGKGLALQFRRAYPSMFAAYERAARQGDLRLGRMHVWPTQAVTGPRYIINFPTKGHWRSSSRLPDIEEGLRDLVRVVRELGITSLAIPPLGCGNGGLDWRDVEPRIRTAVATLDPDLRVLLYPPTPAPQAEPSPPGGAKPALTPGRAALLRILSRYAERDRDVSPIDIQNLLYLLQAAGEPLRLTFVKGRDGPYAQNLRHTLSTMEGHHITGPGDGGDQVAAAEPIRALPGAADEAMSLLAAHPETMQRTDRVLALIDGYESACGLELLASVHWVTRESPEAAAEATTAVRLMHEWTPRKQSVFTPEQIRQAWQALRERGWSAAASS